MKAGDRFETNAAFKRAVSKFIKPAPQWTGEIVRQFGEKTWLCRVDGLPRRQVIKETFIAVVKATKKGKKA